MQYYITHTDQHGEKHQIEGVWIADTPADAIAQMLKEACSEDDGCWEAHMVTIDSNPERSRALNTLKAMWDPDTEVGARLLVQVVTEFGYDRALTDAALMRLAALQLGEEHRLALSSEMKRSHF